MTEITIVDDRLVEIETVIKARLKRQWNDVLEIGKLALEAKDLLPHGQFHIWIRERLGLSVSLIQGYMRFYGRLSKHADFARLPVSAGLLLASPSVPDGALAEIERRLEDGEGFLVQGIEAIIDKYRVFQSVHVGGQAILQEYGVKPDGTLAKQIGRPAVTSLVEATGEALERGVVDIEGTDQPLPDLNTNGVFKPIPDLPNIPIFTIPNTVKAAANSATARRQDDHVQGNSDNVIVNRRVKIAANVVSECVTFRLTKEEAARLPGMGFEVELRIRLIP